MHFRIPRRAHLARSNRLLFNKNKTHAGPDDEPNGASDILSFYNLRRLHDLTQSGTFVRQQQEQARQQSQQQGGGGVPGDVRLWKRGPFTGLAPLASKPAPSVPAGSRPALATAPLARSLASLQRGTQELRDGQRGELVAEGAGEESAAAVLLPAAGRGAEAAAAAAGAPQQFLSPPTAAGAGAAGAAAASPAKPKIKLKVKFGGGAKKS